MPLETYLLYLGAVAVFFATPPDTSQLLVISNSARFGLSRSVMTIAGDLSANCLQMTAAAFGLAAVIAASATAFVWIKWLGVAYLIWIGLQMMLGSGTGTKNQITAPGARAAKLFRQGFFTSMANPFAVVFFGSLFPQFIDPALPVLPQLLFLGATYLVVDGTILLAWGWLGSRAAARFGRLSFGHLNRICGAMIVGAAGLLAFKDLEPQR